MKFKDTNPLAAAAARRVIDYLTSEQFDQSALAEHLGVSQALISCWKNGCAYRLVGLEGDI